jgi:DNA-binding XRE family transcriptional regulator
LKEFKQKMEVYLFFFLAYFMIYAVKGGAMADTLGDRIRGVRGRKRMTQAALARAIGISSTAMNAIESGQVDPRASRIAKLAEVLHVSTDYLLGLCPHDGPGPQPARLAR